MCVCVYIYIYMYVYIYSCIYTYTYNWVSLLHNSNKPNIAIQLYFNKLKKKKGPWGSCEQVLKSCSLLCPQSLVHGKCSMNIHGSQVRKNELMNGIHLVSRKEWMNIWLKIKNYCLHLVSEVLTLLSLKHGFTFLCPVSTATLDLREKILLQITLFNSTKLSV